MSAVFGFRTGSRPRACALGVAAAVVVSIGCGRVQFRISDASTGRLDVATAEASIQLDTSSRLDVEVSSNLDAGVDIGTDGAVEASLDAATSLDIADVSSDAEFDAAFHDDAFSADAAEDAPVDTAPVCDPGPTCWSRKCHLGVCDRVIALAMANVQTCVLLQSGDMHCWGALELANQREVFARVEGGIELSIGVRHMCILKIDGSVACVGDNGSDALGRPIADGGIGTRIPGDVVGVSGATQIGAGQYMACASTPGRNIQCWGNTLFPGVYPSGNRASTATEISLPEGRIAYSGGSSPCSANATGTRCTDSSPAGLLPANLRAFDVDNHACGVDGTDIVCTGTNLLGEIGDGTTSASSFMRHSSRSWIDVDVGYGHTCAVDSTGQVWCWGSNTSGALGDGTRTSRLVPTSVDSAIRFTRVEVTQYGACAISTDGAPYCWGDDSLWTVSGSLSTALSPTPAPLWGRPLSMSMQDRHACAVLSDGSVACAGATVGLVESDTPEIVSGMSNAREVVVTQDSACALRANGTVWCWGPGIGSPTPTQIVGAVDARSISAGYRHVCVLEGASGDAKCFGHNGQLQLGYVGTSSGAFVDIGLSGMLAVTAAGNATCVLRTTGVVSCFGYGGSNQLGNGMTVDSATPVDVIGVTTAIGLAASSFNSGMCALLGDGTMQCWGTGLPTTAVSIPGERIQRVANSCVATDAGRIWCFRSAPWSTPVLLIDGGATVMAPVPLGDAGCFGGTSGLICTGPRADSGRFGVVPVRRFLSPTRVASPP